MVKKGKEDTFDAGETETSTDFLTNLGKALREEESMDIGLVAILAQHLLVPMPGADAVTKAKEAILKLADDRANPPKSESTDA